MRSQREWDRKHRQKDDPLDMRKGSSIKKGAKLGTVYERCVRERNGRKKLKMFLCKGLYFLCEEIAC